MPFSLSSPSAALHAPEPPGADAAAPRLGPADVTRRAGAGAARGDDAALQRVVKVRRDYNAWVARESMEDYALRFTPHGFRKWSALRVANTAFGAASFLVLEAVGGTLLVDVGFINAFWAILATGLIIFAAGWPISVYAARHGVDMDLLTRGAGFGYIGSTITSLIYASFTFIFFALEAAIMAYALELAFDIPPAWGYLLCALVVIPLVTHGVTTISRLQVWTQPLWLVMLVLPYVYVLRQNPGVLNELWAYGGADPATSGGVLPAGFDLMKFGSALTVGIALITQMGEQADTLRFMPEPQPGKRLGWWAAVAVGGPGWVIPGVLKMLGGALLAYLAIGYAVPLERAVDPNQMYLVAWGAVFANYGWAVAATALFVVVSQLKINVTNAYAGSLAWSNFFARLTHSHPGRVVWMLFNIVIALMLMELGVFQAIGQVLGMYANIAIAWMMAVVADLVINKPMGWSPKGIEFKRAHLYDINPVGVGAMALASLLSMLAHAGLFGPMAQAFSACIALVTAFIASPVIAWATRGRYYLARQPEPVVADTVDETSGGYPRMTRCVICERAYEGEDMALCPAYRGAICSLCCSLDARCHDLCKPQARLALQWRAVLRALLPTPVMRALDSELGHTLMLMTVTTPLLAGLMALLYQQSRRPLGALAADAELALQMGFVKLFAALLVLSAVVTWWLVLKHRSAQVAQEESNRQTALLVQEIESHRLTDLALQQAKQAADQASLAKTRYVSTISHELRTPLNSIIGYAQLLDEDESIPPHRKQAVSVIRRGGDHLLGLIEGTLDMARIESGKLALDVKPMRFTEGLDELARMFEQQAASKGIGFAYEPKGSLPPVVRADEKRLRQVLINVLGNAVKFTRAGQVTLRVSHRRDMAHIEVEDTGPGMSAEELAFIFEPFARGATQAGGTGLGLTISKMLTDLMGGEMTVSSTPGQGSVFRMRLFLPAVRAEVAQRELTRPQRTGYLGPRQRILVVDNEEVDRELLRQVLVPLGFEVHTAASGHDCLAVVAGVAPQAVLMDLAMPGIDGWETIRRLRAQGLSAAPVAIVSANAFDRGLDNDVGITPADWVVKPVRRDELLDWLGRALALQWVHATPAAQAPVATPIMPGADTVAAAAAAAAPVGTVTVPPPELLQALADQVALGYFKGIHTALDRIEAAHPDHAPFVAPLRALARQFQLDGLAQRLALLTAPSP